MRLGRRLDLTAAPECQCQKRKSLVVITSDDPSWLSLNLAIAKYVRSTEGDFDVLDVRDIDFLGFSIRRSPSNASNKDFLRRLQLGPADQVLIPKNTRRSRGRPTPSWLIQSSESALFSHLKTPHPRKNSLLFLEIKRRFEKGALSIYDYCWDRFSRNHYCKVFVPNGRFPTQAAVVEAAKQFKISVVFWERGVSADTMYLGNKPPQDFYAKREFHESFTPSKKQLLTAKEWLTRRTNLMPGGDQFSTNLFSKGFDSSRSFQEEEEPRQHSQLSFFTSSQDEYWALGGLWPKTDWENQYSAFNRIISAANKPQALRPTVRMHPNTIGKSPLYVMSEVRSISKLKDLHPDLRIIWPHQSENSYDLALKSEWVLVWNSTVGIEAMFLGCNVRHLAESSFPLGSKSNLLTPQTLHSFWELENSLGQSSKKNSEIAVHSVAAHLAMNIVSIDAVGATFKPNRLRSLLMANSFLCITLNANYYLWRQFANVIFRVAKILVR